MNCYRHHRVAVALPFHLGPLGRLVDLVENLRLETGEFHLGPLGRLVDLVENLRLETGEFHLHPLGRLTDLRPQDRLVRLTDLVENLRLETGEFRLHPLVRLTDLRPQVRLVRLTENCHTSSNSSHMHLHLHYNPVITMVWTMHRGATRVSERENQVDKCTAERDSTQRKRKRTM